MSRAEIEFDPDAVTNARAVFGAPFARRPDPTRNVPTVARSRVDTPQFRETRPTSIPARPVTARHTLPQTAFVNPTANRRVVERRWPLWLLTFVCAAALVSAGYLAALVQVQYPAGHGVLIPQAPAAAPTAAAPSRPETATESAASPARPRPSVGAAQEPRRVLPRPRANAKSAPDKRPEAARSAEEPSTSPVQDDSQPVLRILPLPNAD